MACSKLFSGELPELTEEIIQYLRKDFSTLYSCILVNRLWCRLAIPILWEDPFSAPTQNYHCIKIYLHFLNENNKAKFNEYEINNDLKFTNTLFNYPSFIKYLDTNKICNSIVNWIGKCNYKLEDLVYRSLFEVFIENEGNLHSLEVVLPFTGYRYLNNMKILQNQNLTCNIRNLTLDFSIIITQNLISFLKFLYSSNCKSISSFVIKFHKRNRFINDYLLIEKYISQMIISQNGLKKILFGYYANIYNPFLSLKNSNCSNTLNTIIFYYIDFKNIVNILQEIFDQLNVLDSIHILYCDSLNSDFVQQIIKVIKPFKLISLFINEILHVESLQLLLEKFGDCLENFGFYFENDTEFIEPKQQLFKFIMKYCKRIRYFDLGLPGDNNIYSIIKNNKHNINYLTIDYNDCNDLSSIVLQNLGQVLPPKLEYLSLALSFRINDLEIFLKNSQNTFIKKLLIKNIVLDRNEKTLLCIKKYIMKKERVKYLAILDIDVYTRDEIELFCLKDELNEFKLHNIIVQSYYTNLYINVYNYIKDNYL